jgi:hypothetical protein
MLLGASTKNYGTLHVMRSRTVTLATVAVVSACANPVDRTYVSPTDSAVKLEASVPGRPSVPILVDVCQRGSWETAAALGQGWYKVGLTMVREGNDATKRPDAIPLPSTEEISLPTNQRIKFRFRSWPSAAGGMAYSCAINLALEPEPEVRYRATWISDEKECGVIVTKSALGSPVELPLGNLRSPDDC